MYLGLDIGTSAVKAVVVDEIGVVLATGSAPLSVLRPAHGWSEQDPAQWWAATQAAVLALPENLRTGIEAIGLAGQMHGATLLDKADVPLRPAILWNDGRSVNECALLEAAVPDLGEITGNIAMPGFTAPKLLWVQTHEPNVFDLIETILLPKDHVRLQMTGEKASDMSDSAGTLWLDVAARDWSDRVLKACGVAQAQMPRLHEGPQITGQLRAEVASAWGMQRVAVVAGGGDNAAGAVGVGVAHDGDALLSLGTSGVIFAATADFRPNPGRAMHAFCHALPGLWHQMSVHLSAASCIEWGARLVGAKDPGAFLALAEQAGAATGPELFLPYLSGERTPHNDPNIRGALLGLDHESDQARIAASVLEGVAFAHADGVAVLREAGTIIDSLSVIGGGARSRYWGRILAAALGVRLTYLDGGEVGPALGAARLAFMGATGASPREASTRPPVSHVIEPDAELSDMLAPRLARFRAAYPALTSL